MVKNHPQKPPKCGMFSERISLRKNNIGVHMRWLNLEFWTTKIRNRRERSQNLRVRLLSMERFEDRRLLACVGDDAYIAQAYHTLSPSLWWQMPGANDNHDLGEGVHGYTSGPSN